MFSIRRGYSIQGRFWTAETLHAAARGEQQLICRPLGKQAVESGAYPSNAETAAIEDSEFEGFLNALEKTGRYASLVERNRLGLENTGSGNRH